MNILYFSHAFPHHNSRFIWVELNHFSEHNTLGYSAIFDNEDVINTLKSKGITPFHIPFQENIFLKKLHWYLWKIDYKCSFRNIHVSERLSEIVQNFKPDIIHCHFAYEALIIQQNLTVNIPIIIHFHGYGASQMLKKQSYIRALKRAAEDDRVHALCVSQNIVDKLYSKGIVFPSCEVLYCGIDTKEFVPFKEPSRDTFNFVQVSNLQEKKGVSYSIKAFKNMLDELPAELLNETYFHLIGDGPLKNELLQLASELNLAEHVIFHGQKDKDFVRDFVSKCHVFLHHSITATNGDQEGIPTAIMEAMAIGLPVISTYHSGIPELVESGIHGFLVEEKDVVSYAQRMLEIRTRTLFRYEESIQKIHKKFSATVHVHKLNEIYESILDL